MCIVSFNVQKNLLLFETDKRIIVEIKVLFPVTLDRKFLKVYDSRAEQNGD